MNLLKLKDNSAREKEAFEHIGTLTQKIADKTLVQLEREGVFVFPEAVADAEDLEEKQVILQSDGSSYRTGNVMGFVGWGEERLIIESRFCGDGKDYFFQYLLHRVLDFPNIVDLKTDADRENQLFHFLVFLFPYYLKSAMRKGVFKQYIRQRYNDDNIRGTIDIARHITQNTPFIGRVAYTQREFSYDNSLMELVRHTIEFIKRKRYGRHLLCKVKDEVRLVINATPRFNPYDREKIIAQNKKTTFRHAYFREYRDLQRLCLLILRHQMHHIGSGRKQLYGILFDGAWLWEEYVNTLITRAFYHPKNKDREGAQHLFAGHNGRIYPDFISRDAENRVLADAKYKPPDNIRGEDYLQLLAYMFRFEAKSGYYLYPASENVADYPLHLNSGSTYEKNVAPRADITIIKHGLSIPMNAPSYDAFLRQMVINEELFTRPLLPGAQGNPA